MKKLFKLLLVIAILFIGLICLGNKLGMLDFYDFADINDEAFNTYSNYYFDRLSDDEKKIYIKIDKAIKSEDDSVSLNNLKAKDNEEISKIINKVYTAYTYDNPQVFYISNDYGILTRQVFNLSFNTLILTYTDDFEKINEKKAKLNEKIDEVINSLDLQNKTEYEKELAIHDKLAEIIDYYKYTDIDLIPYTKHTAYSALVEKSSVCDGYAKAFKMLLNKSDIESIIVNGTVDNIPHAWNIVKIEGKYYHVDVTSDSIEKDVKIPVHIYFNVSDDEIALTHKMEDNNVELPKCYEAKYNYYVYNNMILTNTYDAYEKLSQIIKKSGQVLEFKVNANMSKQAVIDELYKLDFNNWKSNKEKNIYYNKQGNVYIFRKNN